MKSILIIFFLMIGYAKAENNSVELGMSFQKKGTAKFLNVGYSYDNIYKWLYYGIEGNIILGINKEFEDLSKPSGTEFTNYRDHVGVFIAPKFGTFIYKKVEDKKYKGVALIGSLGYILWINNSTSTNTSGVYGSFGVDIIFDDISITLQQVGISNPVITDSFIKVGVRKKI